MIHEVVQDNKQQTTHTGDRAVKVEAALPEICLALMDKDLIPSASVGELKLLFYKMKGNY